MQDAPMKHGKHVFKSQTGDRPKILIDQDALQYLRLERTSNSCLAKIFSTDRNLVNLQIKGYGLASALHELVYENVIIDELQEV